MGSAASFNATPSVISVIGDVTIPESALFDRELLFGTDLQYTSEAGKADEGFPDGFQAQSLGHRIARLTVVGSRAVLTSDESITAESGFAKSELLAQFDIVSHDEAAHTYTLRATNVGLGSMKIAAESPDSARKPWVRSIRFDPNGNYLLMEVSIYNAKGDIFNFMESAFPRENLIAGTTPITPDDGDETFLKVLARVGFFRNEAWTLPAKHDGDLSSVTKTKYKTVVHPDFSGEKQMLWYVTGNIPDTLLPEIKASIEGWNRYFNDFRKTNPVMVFKGKLPADIKLGDPRYNVVNFDAVADAGAAYESQSQDPLTGIQSHSLIYLPFAWYNFGVKAFVKGAENINTPAQTAKNAADLLDRATAFVRSQPEISHLSAHDQKINSLIASHVLQCGRTIDYDLGMRALIADGRTTPDDAGRALMRSTLLHEVGHSLGMQHNFKGSLTGETSQRTTEGWLYSSSIMDYNAPALEDMALYSDLNPDESKRDATKGIVQPYDRQFIDIVYNGAKQILANPQAFPIYPTCDDERADNKELGIDPLCLRYDFFASPLQGLRVTRERLESPENFLKAEDGGFITLSGQMNNLVSAEKEKIAAVPATGSDFAKSLAKLIADAETQAEASVLYFSDASKLSYRRALVVDINLLGEWKAIPEKDSDGKPFTIASTDAQLLGLTALARQIPGLANTDLSINIPAWVGFQHEVQTNLLEGIKDAFNSAAASDGATPAGVFGSAARIAKGAVDAVAINAQARLTAEADKALLKKTADDADAAFDRFMVTLFTKFQTTIAKAFPDGGDTANKKVSEARAFLSTDVANAAFAQALVLAARPHAALDARAGAVAMLTSIQKRKALWDFAPVRTARAAQLSTLVAVFQKEFSDLDARLQTAGYLSETERYTHENLAQMIALTTLSLKD